MAYTNQEQVRDAFWEQHPTLERGPKAKRQNAYPTDTRVSFVDFVDHLQRSGEISEALASRVTL
jgi:hypothetical protein